MTEAKSILDRRCPACGKVVENAEPGRYECEACGCRYWFYEPVPTARTKKGRTVGNFSSRHEFAMDDGTTVPACSVARNAALRLEKRKEKRENGSAGSTDLVLHPVKLTEEVKAELLRAERTVDILLVSREVMEAMRNDGVEIGNHIRMCKFVDYPQRLVSAECFCTIEDEEEQNACEA